jgi:hypothetical protein
MQIYTDSPLRTVHTLAGHLLLAIDSGSVEALECALLGSDDVAWALSSSDVMSYDFALLRDWARDTCRGVRLILLDADLAVTAEWHNADTGLI